MKVQVTWEDGSKTVHYIDDDVTLEDLQMSLADYIDYDDMPCVMWVAVEAI